MKSTTAEVAKTADPMREGAVGESTTRTMPAASVSGALAACIQPRSFGLTSSMVSRTCSPMRSVTPAVAVTSRSVRGLISQP